MSKSRSAEQEAALVKFQQSSRQMEATAVELVDAGRALFKDEEPADPHLQRRYRLYRRIEAGLALPAGPERTHGSIAARPISASSDARL